MSLTGQLAILEKLAKADVIKTLQYTNIAAEVLERIKYRNTLQGPVMEFNIDFDFPMRKPS